MNALDLLVQSGKLTPAQAGALGLAVQVLMAVGLIGLALWGWQYNDLITKHHCAAVCHTLDHSTGEVRYPSCDATGEDNATYNLEPAKKFSVLSAPDELDPRTVDQPA